MSNNEVINTIVINSQPCLFEDENDVVVDVIGPTMPTPEPIIRKVPKDIFSCICCFILICIFLFLLFQGPGYIIAMETNDDYN